MKHWKPVRLTSAYAVLSKEEINFIISNKDYFLQRNQCHCNAARIAINLSSKFGTIIEFCEGSIQCGSNDPTFAHCWNKVMKKGKWFYIDLTTEILNNTRTAGAYFLLYETWTADQICKIFDTEGCSFVPYKGYGDWGEKENPYYTKDPNGRPVRNTEENNFKVLLTRYGIELSLKKGW